MSANLTASGRRSARAAVAVWLIAVQVVLTASAGALFCGVGGATVEHADIRLPSQRSSEDSVNAASAAAENAAAAAGGIELESAILDPATGALALGGRSAPPMLSASLSKLVVVVDIIDRRREEGLLVGDADLGLIRRVLGPSDDSAMTDLWARFDGPGAVDRVGPRVGFSGTVAPADSSDWGEMTITAADIARLYRHVLGMPRPDRDLILDALAAAPVVAADGFVQYFGLLAAGPPGRSVAKQGWMCCWGQTGYLHTAGLIDRDGRFVVVLLSRQLYEQDWQPARDRLTSVAAAVNDALGTAGGAAS